MSDNDPQPMKTKIVLGLIKLIASMPLPLAKTILRAIAWLQTIFPNKSKHVIDINLQACLPKLSDSERRRIRDQNIRYNLALLAEIIHIWFHDYKVTQSLINHVQGLEDFKKELDKDNGTLVISPHFGNWELVWSYLCNEFKSAGLYRPPRIKELEAIRLKGSRDVEVVRTRAIDVRKMLKILKQGRSLFVLPDQQPPEGSGEFAEFFNQPAYTMTLLHGLVNRTNSSIWMATCVMTDRGYELSFSPLVLDGKLELNDFNRALNKQMEDVIRLAPEQYQWSYKRFKKTPDGSLSIYNQSSLKT